jgi:hypothetical protein
METKKSTKKVTKKATTEKVETKPVVEKKEIDYNDPAVVRAIVARMKRPVKYTDKAELEQKWKEMEQAKAKKAKQQSTKAKTVVEQVKEEIHEELDTSIVDFEPKTYEELLNLYGGATSISEGFIGNGFVGVRKSLLGKKFDTSKLKEKPIEKVLVKYFNTQLKSKFEKPDEVIKFVNSVKGVCYKLPSILELTNSKIRVHSILKLSKWVAVDSRVRGCFTNHRFVYLNEQKSPVLIINEKTHKVDGYIVPNQVYWNRAGSEPKLITRG